MDQIRVALAWVSRHHFWLLTGLLVLVGAGSWYMASSSLAADFDTNRKKIEAELTASRQLGNQSYHANDQINERQREENRQLAEKVRTLWASLHDRQSNEVLKWPTQLDNDFISLVEGQEFGAPIPSSLRQRYQNYIQKYYPELPKIVDAPVSAASSRSSRSRSFRPPSNSPRQLDGEEENHLVTWDDQSYIQEQLNLESTPTSLRIWVTQEDLWVYVTLLRAIAAVNTSADADRYANAAVRDINTLEVGQPAAEPDNGAGRLEMPQTGNSGTGRDGLSLSSSRSGGGGLDSRPGSRFDSGPSSSDSASEEETLLSNRYLDGEGQPLPVTEGDYSYGTEFKRLPIRLDLRMDQRWLPELISELSNAPLQVEVTEVRINPEASGARSSRSTRSRSRFNSSSENSFNSEPNIVPVALRGIVYIYNPVDEDVLAVDDRNA